MIIRHKILALLELLRQPRGLACVNLIAPRAGHAGTAALARMPALPRAIGMVLTDPATVLAAKAYHANSSAPAGVNAT
jgi:hypothetical protein